MISQPFNQTLFRPGDAEKLNVENTRLTSWVDLVIRVLRNGKVSPQYTCLYISLIDTYPQLLEGESADVQVWRVRENAGWIPERTTTKFFQDMVSINAIDYDPGKYEKQEEKRVGKVTPNPDLFDIPESFDMVNIERRRKAKEEEAKRRSQFKNPRQLFRCEMCDSTNLVYDATPRCLDCHHTHETITDIPVKDIIIEGEVVEVVDSFERIFDEQATAKMPAIRPARPAPVQISLPVTPIPAPATRFGKHSRGIACPDCQAREHWYTVEADWGGIIEYCGICLPPQD